MKSSDSERAYASEEESKGPDNASPAVPIQGVLPMLSPQDDVSARSLGRTP
jgi:hypothetical protein